MPLVSSGQLPGSLIPTESRSRFSNVAQIFNPGPAAGIYCCVMDTAPDQRELPVFPATAPPVFTERAATVALLVPVLDALRDVIDVDQARLNEPTPCSAYTVAELQRHVLAWLQFFADAVNDPEGATDRINTEAWEPDPGQNPSGIVARCSDRLVAAIEGGVGDQLVVMSQARMKGDAVIAMALGEYIVHGWDLAVATGRPWAVAEEAADAARAFLETTVAPEYRGPDSGFFGDQVAVADDASPLHRLLGFAGRDPNWTPARP